MAMGRINGSSGSPPSTSWQSGNQPGRLEGSKVSMVSNMADETAQRGGLAREGSRAPGSINIPFKLMTSRIVDDLEPDERCDKKRSKKQGGDGGSAWSSRNGLLVKREERGRAAFCCGLVYQSPRLQPPFQPRLPRPIQSSQHQHQGSTLLLFASQPITSLQRDYIVPGRTPEVCCGFVHLDQCPV
jgi:hypothetical protein